jgi:hypothetical protein
MIVFSQELWAGDANPVFGATMSLNRFRFLLSHLRFDDITVREEARKHDKFCAAREVFELFNDACTAALQCGESICVDEGLYPTRGRGFAGRQYLKDKPHKYGMLYRMLNDSVHAYTYRAHIYAGRPAEEPTENYIQGVEETVTSLLRRYGEVHELQGRNITFDRFYTSIDLADTLLDEFQMTCTGTLAVNRKGLPAEFKSLVGREEGDYLVLFEKGGKKSLHSWICNTKSGKKNVMILTTTVPILGKSRDDGKGKPAIICRYDKEMGGTDRVDALMQAKSVKWKSQRWPTTNWAYILDTARVNCRTIALLQQVAKTLFI